MSQFLWTGSRTGIRNFINFHNKRWDRDFVFGADNTSITNQQKKTSHIYTCQYMYQNFRKILWMYFEHDAKQGNVVLQAVFLLAWFPLFSKFAIWFKWKAKQNQLKFTFPMLFCISYKFLACFPNIILMSLDSLEWTGFIVHAKNHVIYISESMFNDGHVCFLITGVFFSF